MNGPHTAPEFPELIDNTFRSDFVKCPQLAFRSHVQQIAPATPSIHLHAGGAMASAFEATRKAYYVQKKSVAEALTLGLSALIKAYGDIQPPPAKNGDKSLDGCIRGFESYFQKYPLNSEQFVPYVSPNGVAMIEFTFAIPLEEKHPVTGNPLLYGGRCDMVGIRGDTLFVVDEKTGTSLGEQWSNQWDLDSQMTGYVYAARQYSIPVAAAVLRGIGLLKTKTTHQEVITYRDGWVIDRWLEQLTRDIRRMKRCWEEQYWDYAISKDACNAYGGCPMKMLCQSPDPDQWIPLHYRKRVWDPLAKDFGEKLLENEKLIEQLKMPELNISDLMGE